MKKKQILSLLIALLSFVSVNAQNNVEVQAGINLSELQTSTFEGMDNWGVGVGAYLGASYSFDLKHNLSIAPGLSFGYYNNGAHKLADGTKNLASQSFWTAQMPVLLNYTLPLSDRYTLRIGAGPYLQTTFAGSKYDWSGNKVSVTKGIDFAHSLNAGVKGQLGLLINKHYGVNFGVEYNCVSEHLGGKLLTYKIGFGYTF